MNFKTFAAFQLYADTGNRKQNTNFYIKEICSYRFRNKAVYTNSAFFLDHVVKHTRKIILIYADKNTWF